MKLLLAIVITAFIFIVSKKLSRDMFDQDNEEFDIYK